MKFYFTILFSITLTSLAFSQSLADQEAIRGKFSTPSQKNLYEQFVKAVQDLHFTNPANNSAIYFSNLLEAEKLDDATARSFRKQWISVYQDKGQQLINQFINDKVTASYSDFEEGSKLLQTCLNALNQSDKEFKQIKAKRLFLDAYAIYRKKQEGKLRGTVIEQNSLFSALIPNLEEAAKTSSEAYLQRALGLFSQEIGDNTKAEAYLQKAILIANDQANVLSLGDFYLNQEQYDKAMATFKKANRMNTEDIATLIRISNVSVLQGKADTALKVVNNLILEMPLLKSKQYKEANQSFLNQIREKNDGLLYYGLGYLYENGLGVPKDIESARKWYEYAQSLNLLAAGERLYHFYATGILFTKDTPAELNRIRQNSLQRTKSMSIPCLLANGAEQNAIIFIQDFPKDPQNPIAQENQRLQEIMGLSLSPPLIDAFYQLYRTAQKQNRSYQEVCLAGLVVPEFKPVTPVVAQNNTNAVASDTKVAQIASNAEAEAMTAIENKQFDKVEGLMANAVNQAFSLNFQDVAGTAQRLTANLANAGTQEGFMYYALGYLYEATDRGKAMKWYNYAFQIGYKPAYYKLSNLYKTVSDSKIRWMRDNFNKGFTKLSVPCSRPDGSSSGTVVYLIEYPWDINNPLGAEADRVKESNQSIISSEILGGFAQVYQLALSNNLSFIGLINTAISLTKEKKQAQKDIEFKAVQALSGFLKGI
jgi:tetratricopeptide (TPR) repeat protein